MALTKKDKKAILKAVELIDSRRHVYTCLAIHQAVDYDLDSDLMLDFAGFYDQKPMSNWFTEEDYAESMFLFATEHGRVGCNRKETRVLMLLTFLELEGEI